MTKLNNKGQTLVIFIILLPLICFITFFFIQKLILIYDEAHLKNMANDSCNYYLKKGNKEKTVELIKKNDNKIQDIIINDNNDKVTIEFKKEINDLFNFFNENNNMYIKVTCNR